MPLTLSALPELERAPGCAGVKVFIGSSTGALLVEDDASLRRIFQAIRRRAAFHAEDEYRLNERKPLRVEGDPRSHPLWRDETTALLATQRLVALARESGKRIHVLHITTKEEIEFLRDHKDVASCEATPHHLTMAAPECYERLGTRAQMNPPVRSADHREGIWYGYRTREDIDEILATHLVKGETVERLRLRPDQVPEEG